MHPVADLFGCGYMIDNLIKVCNFHLKHFFDVVYICHYKRPLKL
jgi:hypothetical protein